ncbi:hypothetical protein QO004_006091 [Rhizobium mesoamericanum]|nr:hypothetical protein [Rhizobium mesoamericanum]
MPKQDISSRHFQRKISDFCELRIALIASKRVLEKIRPYLISLIIYRKSPPMQNGRIDWTTTVGACGIEELAICDTVDGAKASVIYSLMLTCPPVASSHSPGCDTSAPNCRSVRTAPISTICSHLTSPNPLPLKPLRASQSTASTRSGMSAYLETTLKPSGLNCRSGSSITTIFTRTVL